ncbi:membrane dipeptidase [Singulisphaera sp. Ch08]|uniref:Membrane dipeptidase n=1 Tax=Singulisphaera sp. Ch08 TaxID=3120278 RepID=A0AAU7CHC6_9BACT
MKPKTPPRLIDLHTDWILQYAQETTVFDPALYPGVLGRLGQSDGYLQGTWVAILSCYRRAEDWSSQADPWAALGALIARIEAEFPGRLLIGPEDLARCLDDPEGLCWGLIGIEGFDALVRSEEDLGHLPRLFERGVRLFQPVYTATSVLAGSSAPGDDRGLTDLGRLFLQTLADLVIEPGGSRPVFDLAHLNPRAASEALAWFEAEPARAARVIPVYSHGTLWHEAYDSPRAITLENLTRLRALGGVVGLSVSPPFFTAADQIKAAIETTASIPFLGRPGPEGIAIGTDFLGVDQTLAGLGTVAEVVAWLAASFDTDTATALIQGNAWELLTRVLNPSHRD